MLTVEQQVFTAKDLFGYRHAQLSPDEQEAIQRRKLMRQSRSKKNRAILLKTLEEQYLHSC